MQTILRHYINASLKLGIFFMALVTFVPAAVAQFPNPSIPLDPGNGGKSISLSLLKPGDIIVSTTDESISAIIRAITKSEVSHAILYIGNNSVIEAVEEGVAIKPVEESLSKARLAVVFRHPNLSTNGAKAVTDFAFSQLGKKFSIAGLIRHPRFGILPETCNTYTGAKKTACSAWQGLIRLALEIKIGQNVFLNQDEFFCSQLVADAYNNAGVDLFRATSTTTSPGDIPVLERIGDLKYVGHLKTP
jgi:cell wall-associated NlpC family hydrolase